jgi:carbonic anhydrase/acetyltransferase-like protein (isoleucine patch superfamily)
MMYTLKDRRVNLIGEGHFIAPSADVIGSVTLHPNASVWFGAVIRGDVEEIEVGEGSNIQDGSVVHADRGIPTRIGKNVTVGHKAVVHGCTVGDNSLIGIGAIVLNHAVIGENCIVGAGALVTERTVIPPNSLVVGSPAVVKKTLSEDVVEMLRQSAAHYVENAALFVAALGEDDRV